MEYIFKGKTLNIPDADIDRMMGSYGITLGEAIQLWLEDSDLLENEELENLDKKAKNVKINHETGKKKAETPTKPRTVKISDEKKALFETILRNLDRCEDVTRENVTILKENKLIQVQIGEKIFKIDIIETRTKK